MKTWTCEVVRKQRWTFPGIEADTREQAKDIADDLANENPPDDDWAYDTTAVEEYPIATS